MKIINKTIFFRLGITIIWTFQFFQGIAQVESYCSEYIRVWGLVKYFPSYRTSVIPNLDSAFLNDIGNILRINNKKVFNLAVESLINYSNQNVHPITKRNQALNIDRIDSVNGWFLNNEFISKKNRTNLYFLTQSQGNLDKAFVRNDPDNGSAVFTNETRFISPYPSVELRLLALARYWNAINYFFPHKQQIRVDWNAVLDKYVLELISCKDEFEFHLLLLRLACLIEDGHGSVHSYTLDKYYGFYQLPCEVSFIDNQLFITKILETAFDNPFKFGDKIIDINRQSFYDYYLIDSCYIWGSNVNRKKNISANNFIKSRERKNNIVRLIRNDSIIEIKSQSIEISLLRKSRFLDYCPRQGYIVGENYIYFDLSKTDSSYFEKMVRLSKKSNIIIDLRTYPNWVLNQIANLFIYDSVPFASFQSPDLTMPGRFGPPQLIFLKPTANVSKAIYKQIIIMVNYTTISRGEFLCMAFQALPNVLTFGDNSAGADGNISNILLPGNISAQFTGLRILYPGGQQTQQMGVKIDVHFHNKGTGISSGQDEELNYVIESMLK